MKKLAALIAVLSIASAVAFAGDVTPVKISLFPKLCVPAAETVHGLDLGIIATNVEEVQGLQLSWIYGGTTKKFVGLQSAFIVMDKKAEGLTYGFVNQADSFTGLQLGFVNITNTMKGVQIGLVNIIKKGVVPAMVFVNASF